MSRTLAESKLLNPLEEDRRPKLADLVTASACEAEEAAAVPPMRMPQHAFVKSPNGRLLPVMVVYATKTVLPVGKGE